MAATGPRSLGKGIKRGTWIEEGEIKRNKWRREMSVEENNGLPLAFRDYNACGQRRCCCSLCGIK